MKRAWIVIVGLAAVLALYFGVNLPARAQTDQHVDGDLGDTPDEQSDDGADQGSVDLSVTRTWQGTIRVKSLNVRAGPGEGYDIVAQLKHGDKVTAVDQSGKWVRIVGLKADPDNEKSADVEAWVYRAFLDLPKDFLAPAFGDAENDFVDWAIERGDLAELSVESNERLSVVLAKETDPARADGIALEIGCAYREQLKIANPVVVTVWSSKGAVAGWLAQVTCP